MKVHICYTKNGFGPYNKIFENSYEATEWLKENEVKVMNIIYG